MSPITVFSLPITHLFQKLRQFQQSKHPAAGMFKQAPPPKRKPAPVGPKVFSPDSVHLRAGAQGGPLRKNPAP